MTSHQKLKSKSKSNPSASIQVSNDWHPLSRAEVTEISVLRKGSDACLQYLKWLLGKKRAAETNLSSAEVIRVRARVSAHGFINSRTHEVKFIHPITHEVEFLPPLDELAMLKCKVQSKSGDVIFTPSQRFADRIQLSNKTRAKPPQEDEDIFILRWIAVGVVVLMLGAGVLLTFCSPRSASDNLNYNSYYIRP